MGAEFKTGTELPNESVKSSMSSISNATAFWGCMTALLTEYKDKTYTYSDIKGFIGDYVAQNAATSWQGKCLKACNSPGTGKSHVGSGLF